MSLVFNYVRKAVSRDRRRYRDGQFDLDLSYVTDRIVAMGFPGSGLEGTYRNNIDSVSRFLNEKLGASYMVFNLSDRKYDYSKFNFQVVDCGFWDHHPPPLKMLFEICHRIHIWLSLDPENVAVIHCIAGKGRTGLVISSYLLYASISNSIWQGLFHFAVQRSETEEGVSMPSQIRYAYLFSEVLSGELKIHPRPMILKEISISGEYMPKFERDGFRPLLYIYSGRKLIHSSEWEEGEPQFYASAIPGQRFVHPCRCLVFGDITVHMYHAPSGQLPVPFRKQNPLVFRTSLHTSFLEQSAVQCDGIPEDIMTPAMNRKRGASKVASEAKDGHDPTSAQKDVFEEFEHVLTINEVDEDDQNDSGDEDLFFVPPESGFHVHPSFRSSSSLSNSLTQVGWKEITISLRKEDLDGPHADDSSRYPPDFGVTFTFDCPPSSIVDIKAEDLETSDLLRRRVAKLGNSISIDRNFKTISLQHYVDDIGKYHRMREALTQEPALFALPLQEDSPIALGKETSESTTATTGPKPIQRSRASTDVLRSNSLLAASPSSPRGEQFGSYRGPFSRKTVELGRPSSVESDGSQHSVCHAALVKMAERVELLQMENERLRGLLNHQHQSIPMVSPGDAVLGGMRPRSTSGKSPN
eukprot:TRINITY_DN8368_c0_g1_i1.p1 TRINITY_DN8368_c0_g1~~TRINITY_DN8368_c0_g1_i1.p1  ORF type:complete len:640 (+),score=139.03 TRINITY_DN8368_c0_g1_i1:53-1972(+)